MAMGTPVVSTPAGCAALAIEEGREILTAEGEEELAAAVLKVLSNPTLAECMSAAGRRYVEAHHNWEACAQQLVGVYEDARSKASASRT